MGSLFLAKLESDSKRQEIRHFLDELLDEYDDISIKPLKKKGRPPKYEDFSWKEELVNGSNGEDIKLRQTYVGKKRGPKLGSKRGPNKKGKKFKPLVPPPLKICSKVCMYLADWGRRP